MRFPVTPQNFSLTFSEVKTNLGICCKNFKKVLVFRMQYLGYLVEYRISFFYQIPVSLNVEGVKSNVCILGTASELVTLLKLQVQTVLELPCLPFIIFMRKEGFWLMTCYLLHSSQENSYCKWSKYCLIELM